MTAFLVFEELGLRTLVESRLLFFLSQLGWQLKVENGLLIHIDELVELKEKIEVMVTLRSSR